MKPASLLCLALVFACDPSPAPAGPAGPVVAAAPAAPAGPPAMDPPGPDDARFTGRVAERLAAGPYTYLRVDTDAGASRWVVTMSAPPATDEVTVRAMGVRENFHARRLGRTFDALVFGIVAPASSSH